MSRAVVYAPEARNQLLALCRHVAESAGLITADRLLNALVTRCETLNELSERGIRRDDLATGLRLIHYRKRTVIAYTVDETRVTLIGIFHGGQDFESRLQRG